MSSAGKSRSTGDPILVVRDIVKRYPNGNQFIDVLKGISMTVRYGEMAAIMGPSGSGKTTLLQILGLFLRPTRGTYLLAGDDVLKLDRNAQASVRGQRLGFVLQGCDLLEKTSVYENLEYPLIYTRFSPNKRRERIHLALERVGMTHRINHDANKLSGGERQRVAIARALVNLPEVILADEPTGQLDHKNSHIIMEYFAEVVGKGDTAMIMVTHDAEIARHCQTIYHIEDGVLKG